MSPLCVSAVSRQCRLVPIRIYCNLVVGDPEGARLCIGQVIEADDRDFCEVESPGSEQATVAGNQHAALVDYPGEHEAIIPRRLWDMVHAILSEAPRVRANRNRAQTPALLKGLIFGPDGRAMSPTHTRHGDKLYRYYVSQSLIRGVAGDAPLARLPAGEVDAAVIIQIRALLRSPEIVVATWRAARQEIDGLTEAEVREALERLDPLWDQLFPAEQARIVQLLIERVDVSNDGVDIRLRVEGLASVFSDLVESQQRAA